MKATKPALAGASVVSELVKVGKNIAQGTELFNEAKKDETPKTTRDKLQRARTRLRAAVSGLDRILGDEEE